MLWSFEKMYCINSMKQELSTAKRYEHNRLAETSVVYRHRCHMMAKFGVLMRIIERFLRYTGFPNFIVALYC